MKIKIENINIHKAQEIWNNSPNSSIFTNPNFLSNYKNIFYLAALKGNEVICVWPFFKEKNSIKPNFFYYFGPFWSENIKNIKDHSWLKYSLNIYEAYLKKIKKYKIFDFDMHYSLNDIRAFDWWTYKNKSIKVKITPKYSCVIENIHKLSITKILKNFRYVRRYEIKNFQFKSQINKIKKVDISKIKDLYIQNLKSPVSNKIINDLKLILCNYKNHGDIIAYEDIKTKKLISINLLLHDLYSSHLVLSLTDKEWKKTGITSWAIFESIKCSKKKGLKIFDFNGANSPDRGDSKHSFGAKHKLYFNIYLKNII